MNELPIYFVNHRKLSLANFNGVVYWTSHGNFVQNDTSDNSLIDDLALALAQFHWSYNRSATPLPVAEYAAILCEIDGISYDNAFASLSRLTAESVGGSIIDRALISHATEASGGNNGDGADDDGVGSDDAYGSDCTGNDDSKYNGNVSYPQ